VRELFNGISLAEGVIFYSPRFDAVKFMCPCGCGEQVYLHGNREHEGKTGWDITLKDDKITLSPSIGSPIKRKLCGAHYFIKENRIEWCEDSGNFGK